MRPLPSIGSALVVGGALGCALGCAREAEDSTVNTTPEARPVLIAHRGASAYAPEHTVEAYELAIRQGADFIEPDLQITRDGVLVALHDLTLERTTDVREVFPDRFREEEVGGEVVRRWYVSDFDLEEVKTLDAGSWFGESFRDARIPTLAEVIEVARGRAGIYPETKAPEVYAEEGFDMGRLLLAELERHGLSRSGADPETPVVIQSFSDESLRVIRQDLGSDLPTTFLLSGSGAEAWTTPEGLVNVAAFATGIGPAKDLILRDSTLVRRARDAGLTITPWTFRARDPGIFPTVREEMRHYICELGVDGLFTDNPDLFPGRDGCRGLPNTEVAPGEG